MFSGAVIYLREEGVTMTNAQLPIVIRFFAGVNAATTNALQTAIDQRLAAGAQKFTLLVSSPGGTVHHGLTAYNYLKGIPAELTTHNCGSVDSIGVVLFCAGSRRLSVPHARFLLHGVSAGFSQNERLEEKQLEERLKGLQIDMLNIARVIASTTGKAEQEVNQAMLDRTTLDPKEAKGWGLVHQIESALFPPGAEIIAIQEQ